MLFLRHYSFYIYLMKRIYLLFLIIVLAATSCQKPSSPANLFITRADDYGDVVSGDQYILFHIKTYSESDIISHIECTSFDAENGVQKVFDTIINAKQAEFDQPIWTQYFTTAENMNVKYTFTAYTSKGESISQVVHIKVIGNVLLIPYENIIMYSGCTEKQNGLSLQWVTPVIIQTDDTTTIDVYDYHDPANDPSILSRQWRSMTGLKFVRYNDFNFPAATVKYLHDSFLAGNKYSSISDLKTGDVILVGRQDKAIGVFQIQNIYDEEGIENDRYELTFKK